jgi:hypothetical protein
MEAALMLLWMLMLVEAFLDVLYEDHSEEIHLHASRPDPREYIVQTYIGSWIGQSRTGLTES